MVLKLSKKVYFLQFCADLSKKSKSSKAIYIYASQTTRYAFSENGVVYCGMSYCFVGVEAEEFYLISAESAPFLVF